MNQEHGSPWDRGFADAWYARSVYPHKYPNGTYVPPLVELTDPTEIAEYMAGYNEAPYGAKDWGEA